MLKINEALKHEIDLVLTDPDSSISRGARRALNYIKKSLEALAQPVGPEQAQQVQEQVPEKYLQLALEALSPLEKLFTQADKQGLLAGANVDCQISVIDLRRSAYAASDIRAHMGTSPQPAQPHITRP